MRAHPQVLTLLTAATGLVLGMAMTAAPAVAAMPSTASAGATPTTSSHVTVKPSCSTSTKKHVMHCFALMRTDIGHINSSVVTPNLPSGFGPADLDSAYKLSSSGGSGQTIVIVDAMNDPTAASDLSTYRSTFGLPACTTASGCFRILNQNGATSPLPANDSGWAGEESLDVDMASAICPNCHIVLVEANSASDADLYTAEDTAAGLGKFVSNSWGGGEYSGQTTDDSHFNHPGVAITVSAGDSGTGAEYPATSRFVTAVGGTHLTTSTNSRGWTESAWTSSGSGCSSFDSKATWQTVSTGTCTRRAEADVSAVADPATGVAVYQTFGASGWVVYGGTSVSAPIIASVYALAGTPGASDYPASYPYSHASNLFDVTSGSNGTCSISVICNAGTGWDGPTGLGTPNGTAAFTSGGGGTTLTANNPGNQTSTVGTAVSLTLTASGGTPPYTWSATGLPTGLSISSGGVISGTPSAAGTFSVTATVHDSASGTASTAFTWTVNPTGGGCSSPGQKFANPGFESGNVSWSATAGVIGQNGPSEPAHGGTWDAWMDGYGTTHTDSIQQTVTIPAGCTASLTFWLHIDTSETTTTTQFDKLTITVNGTSVKVFSNLNHNTGYALQTVPVSATGSVVIKFTGTEDSSLQTSFVVDDTALTLS